jgi:hypothetical protein
VGHGHRLSPERDQRGLRLPLGDEPDHRVQDDNGQDGDRLDGFPEREGHPAGHQQQRDDEASELANEHGQRRSPLDVRERVGPMLPVAPGRLGVVQAARHVGSQASGRLVD